MKITEVNVFPVNEDRLKAYVSITIDDCFVVRDLKIIKGNNGLFVAMPSKKRRHLYLCRGVVSVMFLRPCELSASLQNYCVLLLCRDAERHGSAKTSSRWKDDD